MSARRRSAHRRAPVRRQGALLALLALGGCASNDVPEPVPQPAVRVRLEMFGGFPAQRAPLPDTRVALVVDATASMQSSTLAGPSRALAARAAAGRFLGSLPQGAPLSLFVLGDGAEMDCRDVLGPFEGARSELLSALDGLRARGRGSLARTLLALPGPDVGGYGRVVAVSALEDGCGGDLCAAAEVLAAQGMRLDLVAIDGAQVPSCLGGFTRPDSSKPPVPWATNAPVSFHVEKRGPDPAIVVCGESGGLPVEFAPGEARVVVKLDPPLEVRREFVPGTRWVLQVIDFPGLDPPERQWRWQAEDAPQVAEGGAPR